MACFEDELQVFLHRINTREIRINGKMICNNKVRKSISAGERDQYPVHLNIEKLWLIQFAVDRSSKVA